MKLSFDRFQFGFQRSQMVLGPIGSRFQIIQVDQLQGAGVKMMNPNGLGIGLADGIITGLDLGLAALNQPQRPSRTSPSPATVARFSGPTGFPPSETSKCDNAAETACDIPRCRNPVPQNRLDSMQEIAHKIQSLTSIDKFQALIDIERQQTDQDLTIDIVLRLHCGVVSDSNRSVAEVPFQIQLPLRGHRIAGNRIQRMDLRGIIQNHILDILKIPFEFLEVADMVKGVQRVIGIPQPAIAIIPRPTGTGIFGQTGGPGRDDRPRILELMELENQGRTNDPVLKNRGNRRGFDPIEPKDRVFSRKVSAVEISGASNGGP